MSTHDEFQGTGMPLDWPRQIEYNRRKNVEQDEKISVIDANLRQIIEQSPNGFLPIVYYGLTRGIETYRFIKDVAINATVNGEVGDAYELFSEDEERQYIPAVAILINETQLQIVIQGDYTGMRTTFKAVNMRTGDTSTVETSGSMSPMPASYLGDYNANLNIGKQVTVLYDLASGRENAIFASVDINGDNTFNWIIVGSFKDGTNGTDGMTPYISEGYWYIGTINTGVKAEGVDGKSVYAANTSNATMLLPTLNVGDVFIAASDFLYSYGATTLSAANGDEQLTIRFMNVNGQNLTALQYSSADHTADFRRLDGELLVCALCIHLEGLDSALFDDVHHVFHSSIADLVHDLLCAAFFDIDFYSRADGSYTEDLSDGLQGHIFFQFQGSADEDQTFVSFHFDPASDLL